MAYKIQLRRDTAANWTTANPTLSPGEIGFEVDTGKFKIGRTPSVAWNSLAYTTYDLPTASATVLGGVKIGSGISIDANGVISSSGSGYSLPTASATVLGGVKIGSGISIDGSGVISAASAYSLPTASATVLGGVKIGSGINISSGVISLPISSATTLGGVKIGTGISVDANGVISAASAYSLPTASATTLGGVKIGSGISIDGSGVISAASAYSLPTASATTLGGVKIGSGINISSGVISVTAYTLPVASASVLGGVKIGTGISVDGNGVISATAGSVNTDTGTLVVDTHSIVRGSGNYVKGSTSFIMGENNVMGKRIPVTIANYVDMYSPFNIIVPSGTFKSDLTGGELALTINDTGADLLWVLVNSVNSTTDPTTINVSPLSVMQITKYGTSGWYLIDWGRDEGDLTLEYNKIFGHDNLIEGEYVNISGDKNNILNGAVHVDVIGSANSIGNDETRVTGHGNQLMLGTSDIVGSSNKITMLQTPEFSDRMYFVSNRITGNNNEVNSMASSEIIGNNNLVFAMENSAIIGSANKAGNSWYYGSIYNSLVVGNSISGAGEDGDYSVRNCIVSGYGHGIAGGSVDLYDSALFGRCGFVSNNGSLVLGNGTSTSARALAFRVNSNGTVNADGAYSSAGADYAEYFEWEDGNPNGEDRAGYFVTVIGKKIRLATDPNDIDGVISAYPSIVGDSAELSWYGRYIVDELGRPIPKTYTIPDEYDEAGTLIPGHSFEGFELNPDWDASKEYIPRSKRKEWAAVGFLGKLRVRDNGLCEVGGRCTTNADSIATPSISGYKVLERNSANVITILLK